MSYSAISLLICLWIATALVNGLDYLDKRVTTEPVSRGGVMFVFTVIIHIFLIPR